MNPVQGALKGESDIAGYGVIIFFINKPEVAPQV